MNAIEKNRNKQLALQRNKSKRGVMAKNIRMTQHNQRVETKVNIECQRLSVLANIYSSTLAEFLELWSTEKKLKVLKNNLQIELDEYCIDFAKSNFDNETIYKRHNEMLNIFIAELNNIDCEDELKLYCCVTHLALIVIELMKYDIRVSSKKFDMCLISFMKELEKHTDKTRFNEVMNILNNTKALSVVNL